MGKISVIIPDDLEAELRKKIVEKYGWKKGNLSRGVEEAIRLWLREDP